METWKDWFFLNISRLQMSSVEAAIALQFLPAA
jgi:hypothetical protein